MSDAKNYIWYLKDMQFLVDEHSDIGIGIKSNIDTKVIPGSTTRKMGKNDDFYASRKVINDTSKHVIDKIH